MAEAHGGEIGASGGLLAVPGAGADDRSRCGSCSSVSSSVASSVRPRRDILELKNEIGYKYIIFMVGLPARGKSYICKKLSRYLAWCGFNTRVFNVGNRRRVAAGATPTQPSNKDAKAPLLLDPQQLIRTQPLAPSDPTSPAVDAMPGSYNDSNTTMHDATFFAAENAEAKAFRERLATDTLEELIAWLKKGGKVAIHDATNSTVERRRSLLARVERERGVRAFFIESICLDQAVLEHNIRMKLDGPDYRHMDPDTAMRDFYARIANYEKVYETIGEEEERNGLSYIKIINVGQKIIANCIRGYLPSQCVFYLMQIHIKQRTIWLTRHGESEFNVANRIGGDSPLTPLGRRYTVALADFMKRLHPARPRVMSMIGEAPEFDLTDIPQDGKPPNSDTLPVGLTSSLGKQGQPRFAVYTSTLRRTMEVAEYFDPDIYEVTNIRFLNEIYAGTFEGMTYDEIEKNHPTEFFARQRNKLTYRYPGPGGESYIDVIERLRPVIVELERMESDVLVVTHQVVMRTLLAYFAGIPLIEMPNIPVPSHTLYCLKPRPYGADLSRYSFNPDTDTFDYVGEGTV